MIKILNFFLLFLILSCESFFFQEYTIIKPKIYKEKDKYYRVEKGDNLYSISKKFNIPIQKIIKSNKIESPFKIYPNQKIFLPKNQVYIVKKGDTLYSISRKFKSDIFSLSSLNRLNNVNQIKVNQKILIPDNFSKVIEKKSTKKKKRLSYQKKMLLKK